MVVQTSRVPSREYALRTVRFPVNNAATRPPPKQKDRRRPTVLSLAVGVDALDFALALDNGHYGSLMSLIVLAGARTYPIKPNLT